MLLLNNLDSDSNYISERSAKKKMNDAHSSKIYKLSGHFVEGDIIGDLSDTHECYKDYNWLIARSETIIAIFKQEDYRPIWRILEQR